MKNLARILFLLLFAGFVAGCEKQEYFKSESEIDKELSYSWKQELVSRDTSLFQKYEVWTFENEKLTLVTMGISSNAPIDTLTGYYKIKTTLTKVFITVSGFPNDAGSYYYNSEWTVVILDNRILVIASEDPHAGGVQQRDFTRID